MKQPCLDCGRPTNGSRCDQCGARFAQARNAKQGHARKQRGGRPGYNGGYKGRAALVRANATRCWICGQGAKPDDPWQADHVVPLAIDPNATQLAPAHRSCNIGRANAARSAARDTRRTR